MRISDWSSDVCSSDLIDPALIDEAWTKAKAFFALPEEVKRGYHIAGGGGARGYTPFGTEIATGAYAVDLKEFWHVGRDLPAGAPPRRHPSSAPNELGRAPCRERVL